MADILIRGMEMPIGDDWRTIKVHSDGSVWRVMIRGDCALINAIPLPEWHGRLGDLTEIEKKLQETLDGMGDRWLSSPSLMAQRVAIVADLKKVKEAPTIIPAEGGTEDG